MGRAWREHPSWEVVEEASAVAGRDVARLLLDVDQDELTLSANAQLATFVLSLVVLDAIERVGIEPRLCAGHSLGEYTALAASGALGFEEGVRLVVERGEAMHNAAEEHPGTMAAVMGADDDAVDAACSRAEGEVWVANYNAPGQVVIAGTAEAVARRGHHRQRARGPQGDRHPRGGRLPHHAHGPGAVRGSASPWPAHPSPCPRSPSWPTSMPAPTRPQRNGPACSPRSCAARCVGVRASRPWPPWAPPGSSRWGRAECSPGWPRRTLPDASASAVATPDDLDTLVDAIAGSETWSAYAAAHQGEHLYTSERVVISPSAGVFEPAAGLARAGAGRPRRRWQRRPGNRGFACGRG